ncbi:MAG: DUF4139 domain-containing protein [Fimbriimonadales bacterium]
MKSIPIICIALLVGCARDQTASAQTHPERKGIELTVYADDFGMVRELRPVKLSKGNSRLIFQDVSKSLDPQSVLLSWNGEADGLPRLVSHSYDLGVDTSKELLRRYLGREVEFVRYGDSGREAGRSKGRLMVSAEGDIVLQTDGKFIINPAGTVVAPAGAEMVTIPQLSLQVDSGNARDASLEIAYLTRSLSWSADYVATVSPDDNSIALECWASLVNQTGTDYPGAKVVLMAGSLNRAAKQEMYRANKVAQTPDPMYYDAGAGIERNMPSLNAPPQAVGELQAYRIAKPADVVQGQMNRLLMIASRKVAIKKDYSSRLPNLESYGYYNEPVGRRSRGSVQYAFSFFNRDADALGVPLPAGELRVYARDSKDSLRYVGAAGVRNTPKDARVDATLADAFDVYTEYRVTKTQKVNKRTTRKWVEVTLHNEKPAKVDVRLVQAFYGRWKLISESKQHVKRDAATAQWKVSVPAGGKTVHTFAVDLS